MILAGFVVFCFPHPVPITFHILHRRIIRDINVGHIIQISKICNLIAFSVGHIANLCQVIFRENVMLVDRILGSACSQNEIL